MSQLIAPSTTDCYSIPLGRRIFEIMKDKGKYYTQQAMANRLGISRTTFSQMLTGNREIYNFEVEKIAADLKVSVSRVLQEDIANEVVRIEGILKEMSKVERSSRNCRPSSFCCSWHHRAVLCP